MVSSEEYLRTVSRLATDRLLWPPSTLRGAVYQVPPLLSLCISDMQ